MGKNFQNLERSVLDHQLKGPAEQEIADQNSGRIAENQVRRRLAPAHIAAINDVVMQQRRGMDKLHRRRQLMVPFPGIIEQARTGQGQHRPHPLATACDQMPGQFGDQGDFRLHPVKDDRIHLVHFGRDEFQDGIQRRRAVSADLVNGSCHNASALASRRRQGKCKWGFSSCPDAAIAADGALWTTKTL